MKMVMPIVNLDSSGSYANSSVSEAGLSFDELRQGVHQARCRYDFVPYGGTSHPQLTLSRIVNLTITSEASDNTKGRRRVLVKVDLPYARFANTDPSNPIHVDKLPTNFGDVSAHLVLSIPSGMKSDCESTDFVARMSAEASLQLALGTLLSALGANIGTSQRTMDGAEVLEPPNLSIGIKEFENLLHGATGISGKTFVPQATGAESFKLTLPEPSTTADPITGLPILTVRTYRYIDSGGTADSSRGILGDAKSPLARGLAGLVPIEENTTLCVPIEYHGIEMPI